MDFWEAEALEDVMKGRTRPLALRCVRSIPASDPNADEDEDRDQPPETQTLIVKAPGHPEVTRTSLFCELFGNLLARELGVETPAPALVNLSGEIVGQLNPTLSAYNIQLVPGLAAGCKYLKGGLVSPVPLVELSLEELAAAVRLYAFDMVAQNPDRRPEKPNCALLGGRLIAYDFEMAFSFIYALGKQPPPWQVSKLSMGPRHLFYPRLRRQAHAVDWGPFISDLARLKAGRINELLDEVPSEWREHANTVRKHLSAISRNTSKLHLELARSLL